MGGGGEEIMKGVGKRKRKKKKKKREIEGIGRRRDMEKKGGVEEIVDYTSNFVNTHLSFVMQSSLFVPVYILLSRQWAGSRVGGTNLVMIITEMECDTCPITVVKQAPQELGRDILLK